VSGLAHFFESEGIPTAIIALVREHAERMKPPRALAVPFELGRPFGAPNEPEFQMRVLRSVLDLFNCEQGPVLEDFPDQPPGPAPDMEGWTCPINLAPPVQDMTDKEKLLAGFVQELDLMQPWYDEAVKAHKHATFGVSGSSAVEIAGFLVDFVTDPAMECPDDAFTISKYLKLLSNDLRSFYMQAAAARTSNFTDKQIGDWLWGETVYGATMLMIKKLCDEHENEELRTDSRLLVPLHQQHRVPG